MLYIHETTDNQDLMELYVTRENEWISFVKNYFRNYKPCSLEKLIHLLHGLQEYLAIDYKNSEKKSEKYLISIADNLARIAVWFAENENPKLEYPTTKLVEVFCWIFEGVDALR